MHATIPKGNMGYDQFTVPDTAAVEPTFVTFLQHSQTYLHGLSCHSLKFLRRTVNSKPPSIPFGLSRALFPTTFLEIAVYLALCTRPGTLGTGGFFVACGGDVSGSTTGRRVFGRSREKVSRGSL